MKWRPIITLRDQDMGERCVVGWWVDMPGAGVWWEMDTDYLNESATHWIKLPKPPEYSR